MADLFKEVAAAMVAGAAASGVKEQAVLKMGEVTMPYAMVDISSGDQPSRLQIDMALDGTQHVVGALNGLGSFKMQFMDCPLLLAKSPEKGITADDVGMFARYLQTKTISDRIVEVILYGFGKVCNNYSGQEAANLYSGDKIIARYRGIADSVLITVSPPDKNTTVYLRTQLNTVGEWYK